MDFGRKGEVFLLPLGFPRSDKEKQSKQDREEYREIGLSHCLSTCKGKELPMLAGCRGIWPSELSDHNCWTVDVMDDRIIAKGPGSTVVFMRDNDSVTFQGKPASKY